LNKSFATFDDSDEEEEVNLRPKSSIRYSGGNRNRKSRIEEDPDFLDEFNRRLLKLEKRL
jgi:hypothetical protein